MWPVLIVIVRVAILVYVGLGVVLFFSERSTVYLPDYPAPSVFEECTAFGSGAEHIVYEGMRMHHKRLPVQAGASEGRVVVFYHGNAGSACDRAILAPVLERAGYSFIFVEYPGYAGPVRGKPPEVAGGGSRASNGAGDREGPSKTRILAGVLTVQQFIEQEGYREVVLVGESIGVGVAGYHASLAKPDRLILISPHYELADLAGWIGHLYPVRLLMRENYTPGTWLKGVSVPTLLIEAEDDEIVPAWSADKLYTTIESATRV